MNTQLDNKLNSRRSLTPGLILVLIGLLSLATQYLKIENLALLFLPGLGLIFLTAALISRIEALVIPGGILLGLGTGIYLIAGPFAGMAEPIPGGVLMLALAGGFALICLLTLVAFGRFEIWPLFPGGIIGLVAAALLSGDIGLSALTLAGQVWPLALIVLGLYLLLWRRNSRR